MHRSSRRTLTVSHTGGRYVAAFSSDTFELWRRGLLRDKQIASFPRTEDGTSAALMLLSTKGEAVRALTPPGRPFNPTRAVRPGAVVAVAVVLVLAGGAGAAVSLRGSQPRTVAAQQAASAPQSVAAPNDAAVSAPAQQDGQRGWLYSDSTTALFLSWTRTGDQVVGSLQSDGLDDSGSTSTTPSSASFTGTIAGGGFTLTFPQGLGSITNISGTIQGSDLNISFPQDDGSLIPLEFSPSTASAYNADVQSLEGTAASNSAAQAQASQAAASASAAAAAQAQLDQQTAAAGSALNQDISNLADAVTSLNGDNSSLTSDVAAAARDLATTQQDAKTSEQDSASGDADNEACGDADTAAGDADTVTGDQDSLNGDIDSTTSDQSSVSSAISTVRADQATWQQLSSQDPGVGSAPTENAVDQAVAAAQAALTTSAANVTSATAAVNADVSKASAAAAAAQSAGQCS